MNTAKKLMLLNMGGSGASLLPFSDDFARADGDVGNGWDYSAGVWTIASGVVSSNPGISATETTPNGNCETGDPPTGYTARYSATLAAAADERTGGVGVQSLQVTRGSDNSSVFIPATVTAKRWYRLSHWLKCGTASSIGRSYGTYFFASTSTSWAEFRGVCYFNTTDGATAGFVKSTTGNTGLFDDMSTKELTTADLFMTREFGTPNVRASIALSELSEHGPAGLILCLDSDTNPQNYIVVMATPYNNIASAPLVYVLKFVDGTLTTVGSALNPTYVAGITLSAEFTGTTLRIYRDGVQLGIDYTVSDASIISNTRHGLFNADPSNNLGGFGIV